jgi:beta-glucosidase
MNNNSSYEVEFVKTPEEADQIILWITPGAKSLFESNGSPIALSLSKNTVDVNYINMLTAKKPTVLVINYTNPWVIDEIYNKETKQRFSAVFATFGTTTDALLDVITGKFKPSGKMPFTTPISEDVVSKQLSDVPGFLKGPDYSLFKFNEGIGYK